MPPLVDAPPRGPRTADEARLRLRALATAVMVTACTALGVHAAFQMRFASGPMPLVIMGAMYLALGAFAVWWLHGRGELGERLRPARGDITLAFGIAVAMWAASKAGALVLAPEGTSRLSWLIKLYHHVGWPTGNPAGGILIMWIAAAEEIAWRGLVFGALRAGFGARTALWLSAVLYAIAHLPTAFLLAGELSGPNPFVVLAALLGGGVWGYLARRTHRLAPGIFAHALFSWAVVEFPLFRL